MLSSRATPQKSYMWGNFLLGLPNAAGLNSVSLTWSITFWPWIFWHRLHRLSHFFVWYPADMAAMALAWALQGGQQATQILIYVQTDILPGSRSIFLIVGQWRPPHELKRKQVRKMRACRTGRHTVTLLVRDSQVGNVETAARDVSATGSGIEESSLVSLNNSGILLTYEYEIMLEGCSLQIRRLAFSRLQFQSRSCVSWML